MPITVCTESDVYRAMDQVDARTAPVWITFIEMHAVHFWTKVSAGRPRFQGRITRWSPRMEVDSMIDKQTTISVFGARWMAPARDCT